MTLTGGAYDHGNGEEWAWSVKTVRVSAAPVEFGDPFIYVRVSWSGDAGENFSARRGSVEGVITCLLSTSDVVETYVSAQLEADARSDKDDPDSWSTKPPPPPLPTMSDRPGQSSDTTRAGDRAVEFRSYSADSYADVMRHYEDHFGTPPLQAEGAPPSDPFMRMVEAPTWHTADEMVRVYKADDGTVEVFTYWGRP